MNLLCSALGVAFLSHDIASATGHPDKCSSNVRNVSFTVFFFLNSPSVIAGAAAAAVV